MRKIAEVEKDIERTRGELEQIRHNQKTAELKFDELRISFEQAWDDFKEQTLKGDEKSLKAAEKNIEDITKDIRRDEAFIEGSRESIVILETRLQDLNEERRIAFAARAEKWLKDAVREYDKSAKTTKRALQRLLAAFHYLREAGASDKYQSVVGEGFAFLPGVKIPLLEGFDRNELSSRPSAEVMKTVYSEITGG